MMIKEPPKELLDMLSEYLEENKEYVEPVETRVCPKCDGWGKVDKENPMFIRET